MASSRRAARSRRRQQRKISRLNDPAVLLDKSAAGLVLSGDSGSGKSNLMCLLIQLLMRLGIGLTLIDPHGDLAADVERYCASLPERLRRKVVVLRFSEGAFLPSINPLGLDGFVGNPLLAAARIASKVAHVARILLYAWGERDFNSKPLLFKWVTRFLTMLARVALSIPDVRNFFDPSSEVYQALTRTAPDFVSRLELAELAEMRPRDREELIASTKNRFLGFLENPIVELVLGGTGRCLSMRQMIRDGMIVIVDLSRGGVLRDEDAEILANLFLNEILYAAFNTPRGQRVPHYVFLDELPVFQSSFDLITRALGQVRKFLVRFVCAFQGTQLFAGRTEDPLLNALIGQCGVHAVFRHKNPVDARFFADLLQLPSVDPWRVKHVLKQLQQYQDGHDLVTLFDESDSWSDAEQSGSAQSQGATTSSSSTTATSHSSSETLSQVEGQVAAAVTRARATGGGENRGDSTGNATTESSTTNNSSTQTQGGSRTRKQSLVPRINTREIVTGVQFLTLEEQREIQASEIAVQKPGQAFLYVAGCGVQQVTFPLAADPLGKTPKFAGRKLGELRRLVQQRPEFDTIEGHTQRRLDFQRRLVEHLDQVAAENIPKIGIELPPADDNPTLLI